MKEKMPKDQVRIDWSRLLGFDQAGEASRGKDTLRRRVRLAKVGVKVGAKPGIKT